MKGHVETGNLTKFGAVTEIEQESSYDPWNMVKDPYKRLLLVFSVTSFKID